METASQIIIDAEALKSQLRARRITSTPRFSPDVSEETLKIMLRDAYLIEVEARGRIYQETPETPKNIAQIAKFMVSENKSKFGLMICGVCGNGKTTMLRALQNVLGFIDETMGRRDYGGGLKIVDAKDVVARAAHPERFSEIKDIPLLAIEDLGREPSEIQNYGNVISPMIDLLEHRYDKMLFTAMTTNILPGQIAEQYGERIADRFREMVEVVVFKDGSFRAMLSNAKQAKANESKAKQTRANASHTVE